MKYLITLFLTLVSIIFTACERKLSVSNYSSEMKKSSLISNSQSQIPQDLIGTYYLHKICRYANEDKSRCKKGSEISWTPRKVNGEFFIRLNQPRDDYFFVLSQDKSFASFTIDLIEDLSAGWYLIDNFKIHEQGFSIHRSEIMQTYGIYRLDEKEGDLPSAYHDIDSIKLGELKKSLKIHEEETLTLIRSEQEYYIDCNDHENLNLNSTSTIKSVCQNVDADLVWFKKVN